MCTISGRRVVGFVILAVAIVIGTLAFGTLMASCQPSGPQPTTSPGATATDSGTVPTATASYSTPLPAGSGDVLPSGSGLPSPGPSSAPTASQGPAPTILPPRTQAPGEPGPSIQIPPPIR